MQENIITPILFLRKTTYPANIFLTNFPGKIRNVRNLFKNGIKTYCTEKVP